MVFYHKSIYIYPLIYYWRWQWPCGLRYKLSSAWIMGSWVRIPLEAWKSMCVLNLFVLQIQKSGFDSRRYQIFREGVGLERGPLSLVSTTEELLVRHSSGSGLENREFGRKDPSRWPRGTLYPRKLVLSEPTSGGRSVGIAPRGL
jgi:hypothetical protein